MATNRHAYLIMAHNEWELLNTLLSLIDDPRNDIFLHIDKKVKTMPDLYQPKYSKLYFTPKRYDVRWGDVGQVHSEMHTGYLGRPVPGKAQAVNLPHNRGGFPVNDKIFVLVHKVAVYGFARDGLPAHTLRPFYCFDFLARISHQPFVKNVPQRGKIIVALCAVHSVIDSDKADAFLWENHFRIHSHLQIVSP